ncbi:MAG: HesA/MoeB/ThiF family protein [Betaproteobacteria bacterium]
MTLTAEQVARYCRTMLLPEVGEAGQNRLMGAKALVVGAGGLGSAAAFYLAAAGVGRLGIADGDRVELSNLQRQILHRTADLGRAKAESAARTLRELNPEIEVIPYSVVVDETNAAGLVAGYDVVVGAVDNLRARYLINEACVQAGIPLVEGAVSGTSGFVTTFPAGGRPCYRCLFPTQPPSREAGESPGPGVLGPTAGTIGVLQATEALKVLLGRGVALVGRLLHVDLWTNEFRLIDLVPAPECPVCGTAREGPIGLPGAG